MKKNICAICLIFAAGFLRGQSLSIGTKAGMISSKFVSSNQQQSQESLTPADSSVIKYIDSLISQQVLTISEPRNGIKRKG